MSVQLNHTIVCCSDQRKSAAFLTEILGLAQANRFGPFLVVELGNGVSLDFHELDGKVSIGPIGNCHFSLSGPSFRCVAKVPQSGL